MAVMKRMEIVIMIGQLIGIWISGSALLRVEDLDFFAIRRIRMPVSPPEMTPPIPRIRVKVMILSLVVMT